MKYILFLFLLTSQWVYAQKEMSLSKAISLGLENNLGIKINEENIRIAEVNNSWARAGRSVVVDLNGNINGNLIRDNNPASFIRGSFFSGSAGANVNASVPLYSGGRIGVVKSQLDQAVNQQILAKDQEIHNLIRTINQQYAEVIFRQEQLKVLNSTLDLSRERLSLEKVRREYGSSNTFNLVQFENNTLSDSIAYINQLQEVSIAKQNLYTTLQIEDSDFTFGDELSVSIEEIDVDRLKDKMFEENFTLRTISLLQALDALNTQLRETAKRPVINLTASLAFAENGFKFFGENPNTGDEIPFTLANRVTGSVGVSANWNLYDGGLRNDDIRTAELQQGISDLSYQEAKLQLANQLGILVDNYNNQVEVIELTERQIELANTNLSIAEERFKLGQITSLDFRNIQLNYLNTALSRINAIFTLILTKNEIDFITGQYN